MTPERHNPTPADRFRAYLAEVDASGRSRRPRPTRWERWRANAEAGAVLVLIWAAVGLYVWLVR